MRDLRFLAVYFSDPFIKSDACSSILPCPIFLQTTNHVDRFRDCSIAEVLVKFEKIVNTSTQFWREHYWDMKKEALSNENELKMIEISAHLWRDHL